MANTQEHAGHVIGWIKFLLVLIVMLFGAKLIMGWIAEHWPNNATTAVNTVVQAA